MNREIERNNNAIEIAANNMRTNIAHPGISCNQNSEKKANNNGKNYYIKNLKPLKVTPKHNPNTHTQIANGKCLYKNVKNIGNREKQHKRQRVRREKKMDFFASSI